MQNNCLSCQILSDKKACIGGIIYETQFFFLSQAFDVPIPGFVVLASKRHVESIAELRNHEVAQLGLLLKIITKAINKAVSPERIYICSVGENIRHLHFYFFPRYKYMENLENGIAILPKAVKIAKKKYTMKQKKDDILKVLHIIKNELSIYEKP